MERILAEYKSNINSSHETGELRFQNIPVVFARAEFMNSIYSELEHLVGASASGVLKSIGRAYGIKFFNFVKANQPQLLDDRENLFRYICAETQAIGWGQISIEWQSDCIIVNSPKGLAAGRNHEGKSQQPVDSYFLGYFEGLFNQMDDTEYHGTETECVAMGDSRCKMMFSTEPVF